MPSMQVGPSGPTALSSVEGMPVDAGGGGAGGGGAGTSAPPAAPRPPVTAPRPEDISRYLTVVRQRIDARKQYPMAGRRLGVEGEVRLRIRIAPDGSLVYERVLSGRSELLCDAARAAVRRAAPFPVFPRSFGQSPVELVVPLIFELTD